MKKISLRRKTYASQKALEELRKSISELHSKTLREKARHILQGIFPVWIEQRCLLFLMITKPMTRKGLRKCG